MTITSLARPEIRALRPYETDAPGESATRLHANEAPRAFGNGATQGLNRYPQIRPEALTAKLAERYRVMPDNVLVTRGSSEGIDLLVRAFCRPGQDNVLVTPPVFGLYAMYASIQGAGIVPVPLQAEDDFSLDTRALFDACDEGTKLVFLCTPNNPVGCVLPREQVLDIVEARAGRSVVIVDEAYVEYSDTDSLAPLVAQHDNLVVLRTLSKALALAGARCGAVIAPAALIRLLDGILAPYAVSSPVIASVDLALSDAVQAHSRTAIETIIAGRERLRADLESCSAVQYVWPSQANFLLVRFRNLREATACLAGVNIAIRTYAGDAVLENCARITVSSDDDNDRLVQAIRSLG